MPSWGSGRTAYGVEAPLVYIEQVCPQKPSSSEAAGPAMGQHVVTSTMACQWLLRCHSVQLLSLFCSITVAFFLFRQRRACDHGKRGEVTKQLQFANGHWSFFRLSTARGPATWPQRRMCAERILPHGFSRFDFGLNSRIQRDDIDRLS